MRDSRFYLQLVNPKNPLRLLPDPSELVPAHPDFPHILLERHAAQALWALLKEIHAEGQILPVSGFRTQEEQENLWTETLSSKGPLYTRKFVALPGCSEHQTGLAIDLRAKGPDVDFICPAFPDSGICKTFRLQAPKYGFLLRYPKGKEDLTSIAHEPWHFRYVGTPYAQILTENNMVLEEYFTLIARNVS